MKKKLESELISIAHRVLKLTGQEDLNKMLDEVALLYQKISVLRFLHTHPNNIHEELADEGSFFNSSEDIFNNKVLAADESNKKGQVNTEVQSGEGLLDPNVKKPKGISDPASPDVLERDLKELSTTYGQVPIFQPLASDFDHGKETQTLEEPLTANGGTSLDESLKKTGFQIGLNDRLAFVNHLFDNNNEDYDRVISQLNTMTSFEEISDFIQSIIKPDYNNWEEKGDYETRFLETLKKKFN